MTARREKALLAVGIFGILAPAFLSIQQLTPAMAVPPPAWLTTPLDTALPFVPATVWLYVSWYPGMFVVFWASRREFRYALAAELLAFLICAVGYLLLPATIQRPAIDPAGGWTAMMLGMLYRADPPMNLFPSYHAAAAAVILQLRHGFGRLQMPLVAWMIGICLSCVLIKQHYVMDVGVGLAVGFLSYELVSSAAKALGEGATQTRQAHSDGAVSGARLL